MEHEYLANGLTETALTTLWVVSNNNFLQWTYKAIIVLWRFFTTALF